MKDYSSVVKVFVWLALLALSGRISFDITIGYAIPITAQSLAVLLSGYYLSTTELCVLYVLYLGGGSLGLPFFSDGTSGIDKLLGKSGGYLYSFAIAAILISKTKGGLGYFSVWVLFILATVVILAIGMIHLSFSVGIENAWAYGVKPFVLGGLIKTVMAILLVAAIECLIKRIQS